MRKMIQTGDKRHAERHRQLNKASILVVQPGSTSSGAAVLKTYNSPLLVSAFRHDWKLSSEVPPEAMQLLLCQSMDSHRAVRSTAARLGPRELPSQPANRATCSKIFTRIPGRQKEQGDVPFSQAGQQECLLRSTSDSPAPSRCAQSLGCVLRVTGCRVGSVPWQSLNPHYLL